MTSTERVHLTMSYLVHPNQCHVISCKYFAYIASSTCIFSAWLGGGGLLSSIIGQDAHTIGNRANEHSWRLSLSLSLSSDLHSTRPGKSPWTTCRGSLQLVKHIMCVLHRCIPQNKAIKVYNVMYIMMCVQVKKWKHVYKCKRLCLHSLYTQPNLFRTKEPELHTLLFR